MDQSEKKCIELLTLRQLATVLQISQRNARALAAKGALPRPIRVGRLVRWRREAVEQWLTDQSAMGESA